MVCTFIVYLQKELRLVLCLRYYFSLLGLGIGLGLGLGLGLGTLLHSMPAHS